MAVLDLTAPNPLPFFAPPNTLSATPGLMRRINLPAGHGGLWICVFPLATDAKLVTIASNALVADDTAIGARGYGTCLYGQWNREWIPGGCEVVYVASATASQQLIVSINGGPR